MRQRGASRVSQGREGLRGGEQEVPDVRGQAGALWREVEAGDAPSQGLVRSPHPHLPAPGFLGVCDSGFLCTVDEKTKFCRTPVPIATQLRLEALRLRSFLPGVGSGGQLPIPHLSCWTGGTWYISLAPAAPTPLSQ
jgi:hypothetical protein